ncbi:universal stress protein [Catenulispora subtropica]|uniref:Universal stress protein n=1 Tax=Catenulispora subtropica TaxID=450798 RepID=A0ABP5CYY7_9ACTN
MNDAVVVGYDQSPSADHTLAEAARAAFRRKAPLTVLNVCPPPIPSGATLPVPDTSSWAPTNLVDSANRLVGHGVILAQKWFPELQVLGHVVAGHVRECLQEASVDAALLVVGKHSGVGFPDVSSGAVALRLSADSACPVIVVPAGRSTDEGPVVAAIDVDEPCDEVLDFAFAEAGRRDVPLEVVHVAEGPQDHKHSRHTAGHGRDTALRETQLRVRLDELLLSAGRRHPGVDPVGRVDTGAVGDTLVEASRSADLMVVGARRQSAGRRHRQWIGPVVHTLVQHSECPVAVVPQGSAPEESSGSEPLPS